MVHGAGFGLDSIMAILSPSFVFGVVVLLYLTSFLFFAIVRIVTGVSIQRIGYFSLRRIAYTLKDGIRVEIRSLGLNVHRPSFAQPTWMSIVIDELAITVDIETLTNHSKAKKDTDDETEVSGSADVKPQNKAPEPTEPPKRQGRRHRKEPEKSWNELIKLKERLKRLHRSIAWLRLVDIVATNSSVIILGVGTIQVGAYTVAVDTRKRLTDQGHIFARAGDSKQKSSPAEWIVTVRNVLLTAEGRESLEIMDNGTLNIHGYLFKNVDGLRDAEIELKLGRVHIPMDDVEACVKDLKAILKASKKANEEEGVGVPVPSNTMDIISENEETTPIDSHSDQFFTSMLRGIKEIHFATSHIGMSRRIQHLQPGGIPLFFNAVMNEVGFDVHRLDPKSPAHRTYFSSQTVAHEALLAALSIAVGVDDGHGKSDRLIYIPMATTTLRTTLPSKAIGLQNASSADERNSNILYANIVVTSPSLDLDPKHLPLIVALLQPTQKTKARSVKGSHKLISKYLPKASIKFSMHEPVFRIALPAVEEDADEDECDLIISSISSVSLDMESSHSGEAGTNYSLGATFRVQSHNLYYQTCSAIRYDFLQTEFMELKFELNASPVVSVIASGILHTFSVRMVRPELRDGILGIVRQLRSNVEPDMKLHAKTSRDPNIVRALPVWLAQLQFEANNFSIEVAGIDKDISDDIRGLAVQADSWTIRYQAQQDGFVDRRASRRRAGSRSVTPDANSFKEGFFEERPPSTNGRRLSLEVRGFEGIVVESADQWEAEPFLAMPYFDVSLSTLSDSAGPMLHVDSKLKTVLIQYSLYRHYAIGMAVTAVRKAFMRVKEDMRFKAKHDSTSNLDIHRDLLAPSRRLTDMEHHDSKDEISPKELITSEISIILIQVKASMPSDPSMMLQIYGVEAGRHRYSSPYFITKLARLYVEDLGLGRIWVRLVSIKSANVELRTTGRAADGKRAPPENVIEISTDAVRLAVPHQVVLHKVFDNVVNTVKAIEQMHHRFLTGTNEYVLEKHPEGPKRVPNMTLRSKALLFELEDGAFEWKLGNIYRAGLIEQQQRLARDEGFRVKARKIEEEEQRRDSTRSRARSAHPQRATHGQGLPPRSRSEDAAGRRRGRSRSRGGYHKMRYDPQAAPRVSASARITIHEAAERLKMYNAQSWKKRIDTAYKTQMNAMKDLRGIFWGPDELPNDMRDTEDILEVPQRPGLMSTLISDLHLAITKPTFPLADLPEFMHKIGKGMPHDMKYSLLIPVHVQLDMGECRMSLRDYPLPFIHVPAMKPGQSRKVPSWSLKTNFIIAEEFRGPQSMRHVKVNIVPPTRRRAGGQGHGGFAIDVRRTVSPVKTYSDMDVDINTALPTRITWGASYQPVIQDMMMIIEGFTKPQIDPSDRVGFWDKIRLSFHSRLVVSWKGSGDVHLLLKGTRDPYAVTGNGAGFIMCWRNDVKWSLWRQNDPKKFMTVDSGDYILAIPDLSHQALALPADGNNDKLFGDDSYRRGAVFKKVIMKLSGNVQWLVGLVFERNIVGDKRSFKFIPHYDVILKETAFAKAPPGEEYDAFRGFRSNHIHLSVAVTAPRDRKWATPNLTPSDSYNSVHLTPRFFTHFFAWWSLFGGTMSLPIRQGRLWPGVEKSSKKFGRHLATIKYSILLAPLFLSHVYKHKEAEDYQEDAVAVTGLKIRLDSFMLDIHQRREWFKTQERSRKTQARTTGMKIHRAQLDLVSADIRALSAKLGGTTPESLRRASYTPAGAQVDALHADLSKFDISDNDFTWVDMDDFVELDWILPSDSNPETKIIPLAYAPGFSYFRDTDHGDTISGDPDRSSPFGNEPTHFCVMSEDDDPRKVQCHLIRKRLEQLEEQVDGHKRKMGEVELRAIQTVEGDMEGIEAQIELEQMHQYDAVLKGKKKFLLDRLHDMEKRIEKNNPNAVPEAELEHEACSPNGHLRPGENTKPEHKKPIDFVSDFNNRFVIHNIQLKWNNSLRNTILRYIHQVSQRRGFIYYLSRRAVKFILDIVEEQSKQKSPNGRPPSPSIYRSQRPQMPTEDLGEGINVQERINELLADSKKFVDANDKGNFDDAPRPSVEHLTQNLGKDYLPQNSYHLRLIAPQIQLQSEKNHKSVALLTASGMELKVVEVMDKDRLFDEVSGLVQRRFSVEMDGTQFFVTHKNLSNSPLLKLYSGSHYGTNHGSAWPPWVPMEVMFDFELDPFGFKRIISKTSASLRYDKYNTLRLKYNDEVDPTDDEDNKDNLDSRMDHLWVHFPQLKAVCDSKQYYTMYIIVLDLLLYSEPLEKTRNEKLEKIMLASDFSDLRGAPEMVTRLQERIRQLEEIKNHFQIHSQYLDKQAWADRITLDRDLSACEDELFFMMKAITSSQRKYDGNQNSALLRWNIASDQISWHLMRDEGNPLVEFQLQKAEYDRTDNTDGSHINLMQINKIAGHNLLPDAMYPEMIAPYYDPKPKASPPLCKEGDPMLRVYWSMREAVAGIPIVEHFEVNLHPLKVELERVAGDKLYEYIFPGSDISHRKKPTAPIIPDHDDDDTSSCSSLNSREHDDTSDNLIARGGSVELRLRPTLTSSTGQHSPPAQRFRNHEANNLRPPTGKGLKKQSSMPSMRPKSIVRSNTSNAISSTNGTTLPTTNGSSGSKSRHIHRHHKDPQPVSDDLTEMLKRSSKSMTLAYVKIPSLVILLSYNDKNSGIYNVEDLRVDLPFLEYRNAYWSYEDVEKIVKGIIKSSIKKHVVPLLKAKMKQPFVSSKEKKHTGNGGSTRPGTSYSQMTTAAESTANGSVQRSLSPGRSSHSQSLRTVNTMASARPRTAYSSQGSTLSDSRVMRRSMTSDMGVRRSVESGERRMLKAEGNGKSNGHGSRRGSVNGNGDPSLGRRTANLFGLGHRKEKGVESAIGSSTNGSRVWEMNEG